MADNEPHQYPDLDYEHRSKVPTYAVFISPACICGWAPMTDEVGTAWLLANRKPHCVLHGVDGVF